MSNALAIIQGDIYNARDGFAAVQTDRSINFEKEAGFAIQAISANEYITGIATRNRQSVIDAVTNIAAIGISLNPAKKQAYLVPRDGKICLDISYMGLLDLAIQSGSIMWGQAEIVREQDAFALNGFDKPPTHQFDPFASPEQRGAIRGAYVVVKTASGDYLTVAMPIADIYAIRDRSSAWKAWVEKKKKCPWVTDEGEMVKKTVIKRAYKTWPKTDRLDQAIHYLNTDGDEGLSFNQQEAAPLIDVAPVIAAALRTTTDGDALKFWKENNGQFAKQPADHAKLKKAIENHRLDLRAKAEPGVVDVQMTEVPPQPADEAQEYAQAFGDQP